MSSESASGELRSEDKVEFTRTGVGVMVVSLGLQEELEHESRSQVLKGLV